MKRFDEKSALKFIALFIVAILLFGGVVTVLWNAILPEVLGVKAITFLQALGILVLSKIFFGGFGRRGGWQGGRGHQWRNNMKEKWSKMTPEEREKFRAEWSNRCGGRWEREDQKTENTSQGE